MASTGDLADLLLPAGVRLVHIGPSKTGTTSLQGAMWAARAEMRRQGVRYLGQSRHSGLAARAIAGMPSPYADSGKPPAIRNWVAILRELRRASEPRAVFSSEYLAHSPRSAVEQVVRDMDPARIHVVVTLRPLPRMLGSRWQQGVQAGNRLGFEAWLEQVLGRAGELPDLPMWVAHRHDQLVSRWAEIAGTDRVTVVVVDEQDHAWILRVFEALVGLQAGTLSLQQDTENRSLTYGEAEAIRALNVELGNLAVGRRASRLLVHDGAAKYMKHRTPAPGEARIVPPAWAVDRAAEVAERAVIGIRASGVRIIGDIDTLVGTPSGATATVPDPAWIATDVAMALATGMLRGAGVLKAGAPGGAAAPARTDRAKELPIVTDGRLLRIYARRKRTDAARLIRFWRGAPAPDED
jgi:hypothetical protein